MAEVNLSIGGRSYAVHCRDGDEANLLRLADIVERQVETARAGSPGLNEGRQLLFAALFLADELSEARKALAQAQAAPPPPTPEDDDDVVHAIESLALRLERLGQRLANDAPAA